MRILTVTLLLYVAFKTIPTHGQARIDRFSQILSREVEDSLRIQLTISKEDTNKVLIFHNLYYTILFSQPDSAMYLAQEGFRLAQRINFLKGQALCKADIGAVWWIIGEYSKANEVLLESLKIAEGIKDSVAIEWALAFLLSNSRDQGNYNEALKYAHRGAAIHKYFNDRVWNVILGSVYQEADKLDSALFYLQKGDMQDFNFLNLAHTYAKMGENNLASMFYKKTVSELTKHNNLKDLADAYIGLAGLYEKKNKPDSAIFYAEKGFTIAQSSSFKKWVYETSLILSRVYEKKDAGKALYYHKLAMSAKDSMFNLQNITESLNARFNEQLNQQQAQTEKITYRNKIRTYVFSVCLGFLLLLAIILWRNNRHKQRDKAKIEKAYTELKATQAQLIQSEKMASLGELTAGIAHEIQNPLNFVNNFSEVNKELIEELKIKNEKLKIEDDEVNELLDDITQNLEKINHHGKRADAIVKGMLQHSRTSSGQKELTDINALADEYLRLAYHGLRAKDKTFNADITN